MKTPDEIKKALEQCALVQGCRNCLYSGERCVVEVSNDAFTYIRQLEEGIDRCYKLAKKVEVALPKWISVEERLPDKPGEVLVLVNGYVLLAWYLPKTRHFETYAGICFFVAENMVTHWMPLPEPPKEGPNAPKA